MTEKPAKAAATLFNLAERDRIDEALDLLEAIDGRIDSVERRLDLVVDRLDKITELLLKPRPSAPVYDPRKRS